MRAAKAAAESSVNSAYESPSGPSMYGVKKGEARFTVSCIASRYSSTRVERAARMRCQTSRGPRLRWLETSPGASLWRARCSDETQRLPSASVKSPAKTCSSQPVRRPSSSAPPAPSIETSSAIWAARVRCAKKRARIRCGTRLETHAFQAGAAAIPKDQYATVAIASQPLSIPPVQAPTISGAKHSACSRAHSTIQRR